MSELDYLDPDDVIKANHTPVFEATRPNYTAEETPPPLVLEDTSESSAGSCRSGGRIKTAGKRRYGRTRPSQCDRVLIGQLDPNRPEIATHAGEYALDSGSQSEADDPGSDGEDEGGFDQGPMNGMSNGGFTTDHTSAKELAMKASEVLNKSDFVHATVDTPMPDRPESPQYDNKENVMKYEYPPPDSRPSTAVTEPPSPVKKFDVRPPPLVTSLKSPKRSFGEEEDTIATSPALAKFITQGNPDNILPKMQKSPPPKSTSARSPETHVQTLPSLKTALSMTETINNGISYSNGHSPSMARPSPGQHMSGYGPSPASYTHPSPSTNGMSPPSMPTHRSYGWPPAPTRDGSQSTTTPSEYTSNHSQSTPSSAITNPSPVYSTPSSVHQRQDSEGTPHANGGGGSPSSNGNGTSTTNSFKCVYPGCTSIPFQTQYLLNSHANVHSSSRPHFCPVAGCNRGPGGKGFKRKNEMIRYATPSLLHFPRCLVHH
jgi:hypothetical protein